MTGDVGTEWRYNDQLLDLMIERIELLNQIGMTLSSESDPIRLLETILIGAKQLTAADGGTIYLYDPDLKALCFEIMRTDSLDIALGGTSETPVNLPPVPLFQADGEPNRKSVVAYAVLEDRTVNLVDAYEEPGFDFSGTRAFDERTGYRSKSMLTVPMRNHENEIIGVMQLLNAQQASEEQKVIPFTPFAQRLAESLGSQAAIALTRDRLMSDMESLFEAFVRMIAEAIDEKSPHTGGHCRRVPEIAMLLADACCEAETGPLAEFVMDDRQRYELHIAALLHDCGKIATPEWVMEKATKLQVPRDAIHEIATRFSALKHERRAELAIAIADGGDVAQLEEVYKKRVAQLSDDLTFLRRCNEGKEFTSPEDQQRVRDIARLTWVDVQGERQPLLADDEVENLTISRGTLNQSERKIIEHHIVSTINMLERLPYPKHLRRVPEFAGGHHERMDGKGYPRGLVREQMSWQARMMGLADVFEALTAKDRPYKKPMAMSQALTILGRMAEEGHIDPDLYRVFVDSGVWRRYGVEHMDPRQLDEVDIAALPGLV